MSRVDKSSKNLIVECAGLPMGMSYKSIDEDAVSKHSKELAKNHLPLSIDVTRYLVHVPECCKLGKRLHEFLRAGGAMLVGVKGFMVDASRKNLITL